MDLPERERERGGGNVWKIHRNSRGLKKNYSCSFFMFCPLGMNVSILFSRKKTPTPIPSIHSKETQLKPCIELAKKFKFSIDSLEKPEWTFGQPNVKWKLLSRVWLFATSWTVVHGILQARILEWIAFPFSSGFSQARNWTGVSCLAGRFFTNWVIRKPVQGEL